MLSYAQIMEGVVGVVIWMITTYFIRNIKGYNPIIVSAFSWMISWYFRKFIINRYYKKSI